MKNVSLYLIAGFAMGLLSIPLEGASPVSQKGNQPASSRVQEEDDEYEILRRDNIDNSDVLAIPFDDSEVEDEEQINRDEKKEVFSLPHPR